MKNDEYGLAPLDKYSEQRALKYRGRDSSRHQLNHQDYYESRSFTEDYDGNNNQSKSSRSEYGQRRMRSEESESDNNVDINKYRRELGGQYAEQQQQQVMDGMVGGGSRRCDACNARLAKSEGYHISVIAASQLQQGTSSSESSKRTAELYKYLSGTKAKSSSSKKEKGDEKVPSSKYSESKARNNNNNVAASESKKRASAGKEKSGKTGLNIDAHLNRYYSELRKLATDGEFSESHAEKFQKRIDNLKVLRKAGEKMNSELFEKFKTKFDKMKRLAESKREIGASAKSGGSSRRSSSLSRYQQAASTRSSEKKQRAKDLALGGESSKSLGSSSSRRNLSRRLK